MEHRFQQRLEKFVGVEKPPTLAVATFDSAEFIASRVRWEQIEGGHPTQFDRTDGYMICVQRMDMPAQDYWADQRHQRMGAMRRGQYLLLDLNIQHSSLVPSSVDCISIYTSRDTLVRFQEESGLAATGQLHTPLAALHEDGIVRNLAECLLPAIERPHDASQLYVDHVALAFMSRISAQHGVDVMPALPARGGLAAWQERRAKEMMLANLDGRVGLESLAAECRLSRSHFARAFKISTGVTPLRWLNLQRVARAKILLLNTDLPLEQIAGSCGFADASHLTRAFQASVGMSPGAWRRARRL